MSFAGSLYILDTSLLSDISLANIFSHSIVCFLVLLIVSFAVKISFSVLKSFYLTEIETASERGNRSRGRGRGRIRLIAEEPDVGLDPITLESRPEPKADA